jgi:hypothetical protein
MDKDFIKLFEPLPQNEFLEIREFKGANISSKWISNIEELKEYKPDPKVELFIQQYTKGNKTDSKGERDRTGQNSKSIKHLWFDIDNQQNLELVLQDIKSAGLPKPSLILNSGGGFHIYFELNERTYKDITPILKSIAPMFKADTKATDIARIMRLEGSHNNKEKYKDNPLVEVVYQNDLSYDLSLFESIADINAKEHLKANTEASIDFESLVSIEFIRECNNKLFKLGVAEGNRNKALGRLTKALEMQNIKPKQAYNHILDWNSRNEPPLPQNELEKYFKAYWNTDYKLNGCVIDTDQLDEKDPDLSEEIKKKMFVFEDIVVLSDKAVQLVLREVETHDVALALKTSGEEVEEVIFNNMSSRASEMLKEDMEYMGPVRIREVEDAQQRIVNVIRQLEESGEIVIARGGESELVV